MIALLLVAALSSAELPAPATAEMSFARLLATRLAMHLTHGMKPGGPRRLRMTQLHGRVLVEFDDQLLMIGKARTPLARRLRPVTRELAKVRELSFIVFLPKDEDLQSWIDHSAQEWSARPGTLLRMRSGIAAADLLEQNAFNDWSEASAKVMKRLKTITYSDILFGDVEDLPADYRDRAWRELRVLGFDRDPSNEDLVRLNDFLTRQPCAGDL